MALSASKQIANQRAGPLIAASYDKLEMALAAVMLSIGLAGIYFVNDPTTWEAFVNERSDAALGVLLKEQGELRLRAANSTLWHDITSQRADAFEGDFVFTGSNGRAAISLNNGAVYHLEHDTLAVLRSPPKTEHPLLSHSPPALEMKRGRVRIELTKPGVPVQIILQGKPLSVRSDAAQGLAQISINQDDPSAPVKITAAPGNAVQVLASDASAPITISADKEIVLARNGGLSIQRPMLSPLSPASGQLLLAPASANERLAPLAVRFSWKTPVQAFGSAPVQMLEIDGPVRQKLAVKENETDKVVELPPGAYRWRFGPAIQERDRGIQATPWLPFTIATLPEVDLRTPDNAAQFESKANQPVPVEFSWLPLSSGLRTEIEISQAHAGQAPPRMFPADGSKLLLELAIGKYSWRARSVKTAENLRSRWSAPRLLEIVPEKTASAPSPNSPEAALALMELKPVQIQVAPSLPLQDEDLLIPLSWKKTSDAARYQLTLLSGDNKVIAQKTITGTRAEFRIRPSLNGLKYTCFIKALSEAGSAVFGGSIPIQIEIPPPLAKLPKKDSKLPLGVNGLFTWKKVPFSQMYRIQIAQDSQFKSVLSDQSVRENALIYQPLKTGVFYWRLRSEIDKSVSHWSEPREFSVPEESDRKEPAHP